MSVTDIEGTRPKSIYRGVAKNILNNRDIDGSSPKFEKVNSYTNLSIVKTKGI